MDRAADDDDDDADNAGTPLLLGERGETAAAPCLSAGPLMSVELLAAAGGGGGDETDFSRLIAQQSSASSAGFFFDHDHDHDHDHGNTNNPLRVLSQRYDPVNTTAPAGGHQSNSSSSRRCRSWIAIAAGTFSLLHLGFVWGSYASTAWTETRLLVSIGGGNDGDGDGDSAVANTSSSSSSSWLVRSTTLANVLQCLMAATGSNGENNNYLGVVALLWLTGLLLPCAFMIASPSWIIMDYNNTSSRKRPSPLVVQHGAEDYYYFYDSQQQQSTDTSSRSRCIGGSPQQRMLLSGRSLLELSMRFAFAILFVLVLLDLTTVGIQVGWTDTSILVRNAPKAGLACFVVGISSAVAFAMVARLLSVAEEQQTGGRGTIGGGSAPPGQRSDNTRAGCCGGRCRRRRSRPSSGADSHGNSNREPDAAAAEDDNDNDDEGEVSMAVLEDSPPRGRGGQRQQQQPASSTSTPELMDEDDDDGAALPLLQGRERRQPRAWRCPINISFCYRVFVFQLGLLAVVFWMPSMYLPIISIEYSGLASGFMRSSSAKVFLWEIPHLILPATDDGSAQLFVFVCAIGAALVLLVFVFPVLATLLGIFTWIGEGAWVEKSRSYLYCIQPALGGLVFSTVLVLMTRNNDAIGALFESMLLGNDDNASGRTTKHLCDIIKDLDVDGDCLTVKVKLLSGGWFYVMQAVLLEIFVAATLLWS